jgi:hypothetical protein
MERCGTNEAAEVELSGVSSGRRSGLLPAVGPTGCPVCCRWAGDPEGRGRSGVPAPRVLRVVPCPYGRGESGVITAQPWAAGRWGRVECEHARAGGACDPERQVLPTGEVVYGANRSRGAGVGGGGGVRRDGSEGRAGARVRPPRTGRKGGGIARIPRGKPLPCGRCWDVAAATRHHGPRRGVVGQAGIAPAAAGRSPPG